MVSEISIPLRSGVSITRGAATETERKPAVVIGRVDHEHVTLERVLPEGAARPEGEEAPLSGEHHVAQLVGADVLVADEGHASHADRLVLDDDELDR